MTDLAKLRLAALRAAYQHTVDSIRDRGWESEDDAWDDMGPSGVHQWCAAATARQVVDLVGLLESIYTAKPSMHGDHGPIPDECRFCEGKAAGLAKVRELIGNYFAAEAEEAADA